MNVVNTLQMRTNNVAVDKAESLTNMKNAALSEKLFITSAAPSKITLSAHK